MKKTLFTARSHDVCPLCSADLVIRNGKHSAFLGCSCYPNCQYIRPLKEPVDAHIVKILDEKYCPECLAPLALRQGRYGMFIACSRYPECLHTELTDKPDTTSILCPQCQQGELLQKTSRFGKTFYSCSRYPTCQFTINMKPVSGKCETCGYPLLIEKKSAHGLSLYCANRKCIKPEQSQ